MHHAVADVAVDGSHGVVRRIEVGAVRDVATLVGRLLGPGFVARIGHQSRKRLILNRSIAIAGVCPRTTSAMTSAVTGVSRIPLR